MENSKSNILVWFFYKAGNKFRNFVFRKRLGRKEWSAKLIFSIMSFFGYFESMVYLNTGETGIFDHYVPRLLLKRWRLAETGTDKGSIFCWSKSENTIEKVAVPEATSRWCFYGSCRSKCWWTDITLPLHKVY